MDRQELERKLEELEAELERKYSAKVAKEIQRIKEKLDANR